MPIAPQSLSGDLWVGKNAALGDVNASGSHFSVDGTPPSRVIPISVYYESSDGVALSYFPSPNHPLCPHRVALSESLGLRDLGLLLASRS